GLQANIGGIIKAVREGKLALFENYDTAGISFGGIDETGLTPLHAAIQTGDQDALDQVLLRRDQVKKTVDVATKADGMTPLKRALNANDYLLANRLVDQLGADINTEREPGLPYLIDAMTRDDDGLRDYLLSKGVDVNARGSQPHSPLALAADEDNLELMDRLVSQGASISVTGVTGKPLLLEAALENEYDEMTFLLDKGADVNVSVDGQDILEIALAGQDGRMRDIALQHGTELDRQGDSGNHLIAEAMENGDHDWFLTLLANGIPVDTKFKNGDTLLMTAVKDEDYRMIDFLIGQNADVNTTDEAGKTALQYAVETGNTALTRTLVENGAEIYPSEMFATAYRRRDNPTMNLLLNAGVDPEIDLEGSNKRVMDVAVADGAIETVRTLLDAGAHIGDNLWGALLTNQDDLVEVILKNGGDPLKKGPKGDDPLEYALNQQRYNLLEPLLDAGADPNPMYDQGESWVSRAVRTGDADTAYALIQSGAVLGDGFAKDGHSLLGWAIANEMDNVAVALVDAGVDVNVIEPAPARSSFIDAFDESSTFRRALRYDRNVRPLMMAAVKRNHEVAQALVNAGAKNHTTRKYMYPISIAAWYSDVRMMQIIYGRDPDVQPRKIVIDLSSQRVTFYENGVQTYSSACSTGKSGYRTPPGTYAITQKNRHHTSSIYGSSMPYFQRLSCRDFGLHVGNCPGYAASHGCIRLPWSAARHYFGKTSLGDLVIIQR
ncbi:MAG: ankyrin repeat domain-containing protein, partial [Verrucomicrobiales bacterium]|nr:ankyrin repeat domain-containing protein [Verrucomicrobiales bacterium]